MSRYREWDLSCKVYVGNLGTNASKYEIEKVFSKYGNIRNVWVARNPPGFAFVEFEDPRDAEDSVRGLDGTWVSISPSFVQLILLGELSIFRERWVRGKFLPPFWSTWAWPKCGLLLVVFLEIFWMCFSLWFTWSHSLSRVHLINFWFPVPKL